ncbi:hypothetical protein JXA32_03130 [Candidatus Sumerlaeota bacterium]|nr:hypothetical protein [Candidatus Sumerlaeota bacterium]
MNEDEKQSSGSAQEGVNAQARRLHEKLAAMKTAMQRTKRTGFLLAILVAVVAIAGVYVLLSPVLSAYQNPAPYQQAFSKEVEQRVLPALQLEAQELLKNTGPVVVQIVRDKSTERLPEFSAQLEKESKLLVDNLSAEAEKRLQNRSQSMVSWLEKVLKAELPEAADPEKAELIASNMQKAAQGALDRFLDTYLKDHINSTKELQRMIDEFPIPEHIQAMSDAELENHLTHVLGAYAVQKLASSDNPNLMEFFKQVEASRNLNEEAQQ